MAARIALPSVSSQCTSPYFRHSPVNKLRPAGAARSSWPHYASDGNDHLLPPGALDREPFASRGSEAVVPGATGGRGRFPLRDNQAALLEAVKRRVERAMVHSQHIVGQPLDRTGNFVPVRPTG